MINYNYIAKAIEYYKNIGYQYIDVPWMVNSIATSITKPPNKKDFATYKGLLVGSAEQSFISMMINNQITSGKYVAATPCFRDEKIEDELHKTYFFKVELIHISNSSISDIVTEEVAKEALELFKFLSNNQNIKTVYTPEGIDININDIELGSYGKRSYDNWYWVYGTGLAEPRFSYCVEI